MKSYESVSSLNSDGPKAIVNTDEHYYDSVPIDSIEGDYVYIQPGGSDGTATLPMEDIVEPQLRAESVGHTTETESPERNSNYVNIDYFLQ